MRRDCSVRHRQYPKIATYHAQCEHKPRHRAYLQQGVRPHINLYGVRYTNRVLALIASRPSSSHSLSVAFWCRILLIAVPGRCG